MNEFVLLQMLQVCDSLFPIGAFTLSNGLETLVQNQTICTAKEVERYVRDFLRQLPFNELGAAHLSYRSEDAAELMLMDQILSAARGPEELRTASRKLCQRFLKTTEKTGSYDSMKQYYDLLKEKKVSGQYGLVMGLYMKDLGIEEKEGLVMFGYSLISATIINAVKLIPLSQMEGQRILKDMFPEICRAAEKAQSITMMDLGIGGAGIDISSMQHETLYSRMYIS